MAYSLNFQSWKNPPPNRADTNSVLEMTLLLDENLPSLWKNCHQARLSQNLNIISASLGGTQL